MSDSNGVARDVTSGEATRAMARNTKRPVFEVLDGAPDRTSIIVQLSNSYLEEKKRADSLEEAFSHSRSTVEKLQRDMATQKQEIANLTAVVASLQAENEKLMEDLTRPAEPPANGYTSAEVKALEATALFGKFGRRDKG